MKILVVSTHPDDETLGCGGTLLKHRAAGDELYWLIATSPSRPQWQDEVIQAKVAEVAAVATRYGMQKVFRLGFPAAAMDQVSESELIGAVRQVVEDVKPEMVYTIHCGDVHSDHRAVFDALLAVIKPFYMKKLGVHKVLSFETLSSTDAAPPGVRPPFVPNVYSDITGYLEEKLAVMKLFASELHEDPAPRGPSAIESLARYRGATISVEHAEAFMLVREVF